MIKITCRPRVYGGFSSKMSVRQKWDGEEVEPLYEGTFLAAVDLKWFILTYVGNVGLLSTGSELRRSQNVCRMLLLIPATLKHIILYN